MNNKRRAAIIGAAATTVGQMTPRGDQIAEGFEHDILGPVVLAALADAGIGIDDVDSAIFTLPPPSTRQLGFATFMCARLGLRCSGQVAEVVQMGITGGLAFDMAVADVVLGRAEVAVCAGIALSTATDTATAADASTRVVGDVDFQSPFGVTPISWYAFDAARYIHETGVSREAIAQVAVKSRGLAEHNELAQFRTPLTLEAVLSARMIVEPLGLFEVPAVADGAICLVVARQDLARDLQRPYAALRGRGFYHEGYHQMGDEFHDLTAFPAAQKAAAGALVDAELTMDDISLAELYAPCTITEVLVTEALGICQRGRGAFDVCDGQTSLGGRLPVNTSGGCLSRGHPPPLTALYGLLEVRQQLLSQAGQRQVADPRFGLHCCELGNYNAALVHVLERGP